MCLTLDVEGRVSGRTVYPVFRVLDPHFVFINIRPSVDRRIYVMFKVTFFCLGLVDH